MRNIHSHKKAKKEGEGWQQTERDGGREWEEDQRGEKWQKIQDGVMEERREGDKSR